MHQRISAHEDGHGLGRLAAICLLTAALGLLVLPSAVLFGETALLVSCAALLIATHFWFAGSYWLRRLSPDDRALHEYGIGGERDLGPALEQELARSRRSGREFALVLTAPESLRRRFDFRNHEARRAALLGTLDVLARTRQGTDRIYRYGADGFALLLAESDVDAVRGMVRRLRRAAREAEAAGGNWLPLVFGASFYPSRATGVDTLRTRAEMALKLARSSATRLHVDAARAPGEPPPESLRAEPGRAWRGPPKVEPGAEDADGSSWQQLAPGPTTATLDNAPRP